MSGRARIIQIMSAGACGLLGGIVALLGVLWAPRLSPGGAYWLGIGATITLGFFIWLISAASGTMMAHIDFCARDVGSQLRDDGSGGELRGHGR
jgi:hypothetical protein